MEPAIKEFLEDIVTRTDTFAPMHRGVARRAKELLDEDWRGAWRKKLFRPDGVLVWHPGSKEMRFLDLPDGVRLTVSWESGPLKVYRGGEKGVEFESKTLVDEHVLELLKEEFGVTQKGWRNG